MKKWIICLGVLYAVGFSCELFGATEKFSAYALEWWLRGQGKLDGASVRTRSTEDGKYEIFEWKVSGVPQPSDAEVEQIIKDYETAKNQEKITNQNKKAQAIQKLQALGVTQEDIEALSK